MIKTKITFALSIFYFGLTSCQEGSKSINFDSFNSGLKKRVEASDGYDISQRMAYYNVPGVSIAVVENGKLEWAKGYSVANTVTGYKVDEKTLFQAGSISKPIAAKI